MKGYVSIEKHEKLQAESAAYRKESTQQIELLKFQLAELKRMIFGAKSERYIPEQAPEQLSIFASQEVTQEAETSVTITAHQRKKTKSKKKPARLVLPANLERREEIIEPVVDTSGMKKIGAERTEILVYTPAELFVKVLVRPKYAPQNAPADVQIAIADLPDRFIDKGIADESLLAAILVDKYVDHLPLYRTAARLTRLGMTIPRSTLSGWVAQSADRLLVLYEKLAEVVLKSTYIMVDETRIQVQTNSPPKKKGGKPKKSKTHRGFYWGYQGVAEKLLFFEYNPSRDADNPARRLKTYTGTMQTDCYEVYDQIRVAYPQLTHYHCLNHARREFEKALPNDQQRADHALKQFQKLYAIERQAKKENWSPSKIRQIREAKARPILEKLYEWMDKESPQTLPKSPIGKAMGYMLKRKERMMHYLTDGKLNIDTNPIENAIRPIAVGRKNYLFAGSHEAAQRGAIFYSFFGCCKLQDVDPNEWLLDVMQRLPNHPVNRIEELLPHRWKIEKHNKENGM